MALKAKKEASAPPKGKAKARALKAKKAALKGVHGEGRSARHPPSHGQRHHGSKGSLNILGKEHPKKQACQYAIIKFPLTTEPAMKKREHSNTPVFVGNVKANKHQIKPSTKKLCDTDVVEVNS